MVFGLREGFYGDGSSSEMFWGRRRRSGRVCRSGASGFCGVAGVEVDGVVLGIPKHVRKSQERALGIDKEGREGERRRACRSCVGVEERGDRTAVLR